MDVIDLQLQQGQSGDPLSAFVVSPAGQEAFLVAPPLEALEWLGIDHDGEAVRQSERLPSFERAMRTLAEDDTTRSRLAAVALERARAMTWPKGARAALDALAECAR